MRYSSQAQLPVNRSHLAAPWRHSPLGVWRKGGPRGRFAAVMKTVETQQCTQFRQLRGLSTHSRPILLLQHWRVEICIAPVIVEPPITLHITARDEALYGRVVRSGSPVLEVLGVDTDATS